MEDANAGWFAAIAIGGFAGWLAEKYLNNRLSMFMNVGLGVIGAIIAGGILSWFGATWAGWIGYLIGGFAGACVLIAVARLFSRI